MLCAKRRSTLESETLLYLLGPTKCFTSQEMQVYNLARLCRVKELDKGVDICEQAGEDTDADEKPIFRPWTDIPKPLFRQTYTQWKATMDMSLRLRQIKNHKVICIQPLDDFPEFIHKFQFGSFEGFFEFLRYACQVFFTGFEVRLLPPIHMENAGWKITSRIHEKTKQKQYLVKDIQKYLQKHIPKDGYCSVGVSWTDLYPSEDMNFVLGEASAAVRNGVLCFGRFEPKRYKEGEPPPPTIKAIDARLVWRMIKVITHETCHILGVSHCNFFDCSMNESNAMDQAMNQPLFLCPVCLRKIHKSARFDMERRYRSLLEFLESLYQSYDYHRIDVSIQWLKRVLELLNSVDRAVET